MPDDSQTTDTLCKLFERADELDPLAWIGPPLDPNLVERRRQSVEQAKRDLGVEIEIGVR
jgi:hypothetical protein